MNRVVITGADGMLGQDIVRTFRNTDIEVTQLDINDVDIIDKNALFKVFSDIKPHVVINCAAYTDVDGCESSRSTAFSVNATGAGNVASATHENHALIIHVSTDYVFDGSKKGAYNEDDSPNPINVYGESKLEGEKQVAVNCIEHIILRTSWLYGAGGKNFVDTIIELAKKREELSVVNDQHGSPTYTLHLASGIKKIVFHIFGKNRISGIFNITGSGSCSWYDFALEILKYKPGSVKIVKPVGTEEFPRPATRPHNSILNNDKLHNIFSIEMPHWKAALSEYLK